jgi:pyruvate/2-oxoglutarate/acetoin dehydrogenase E1 component
MRTGSEQLAAALRGRMESDPNVVVLGEALELSPVTSGLLAAFPGRVHLLPAADASLVGVAVGLAMAGKRPVVELAESASVWGVLQQVGQEAASLKDRGEFRAPIVVRVPIAPGTWDPTAIVEGVAGLAIGVVGTPGDAAHLLASALEATDPVVLLEPRAVLADRGEAGDALGLGKARVLREGDHATVLALGDGVAAAMRAADVVEREGISVEVIDLRWVRPLDVDAVGESVAKTGRAIVAGASPGVLALAVQQAFLRLESPPTLASSEDLAGVIRSSVHY